MNPSLEEWFNQPHFETNERGERFKHPGYTMAVCYKCKKDFIIGKKFLRDYFELYGKTPACGSKICEEEQNEFSV